MRGSKRTSHGKLGAMDTPTTTETQWATIYSTHWNRLLSHAAMLTPLLQAEDIVQEAMVQALKSNLQPSAGMLHRLVRIQAAEMAKKELRQKRRDTEWMRMHTSDHLEPLYMPVSKGPTNGRMPNGGTKLVGAGRGNILAKVPCPICNTLYKPRMVKGVRQATCSQACAHKKSARYA